MRSSRSRVEALTARVAELEQQRRDETLFPEVIEIIGMGHDGIARRVSPPAVLICLRRLPGENDDEYSRRCEARRVEEVARIEREIQQQNEVTK